MIKHPILLVDDEEEILFSLRGLLRHEFDLHTATSGAEALALLQQQPIHVIVADQRMPGMTGVELLQRAQKEYPQTIRIVFTGYADLKAVIDAVNQAQIFRYLTKPWDPDELCAVLHQACDHFDWIAEHRRLLLDVRAFLGRCQPLFRSLGERLEAAALAEEGTALAKRLEKMMAEGTRSSSFLTC
jgi:response regulator RpfG family c-di-GMP phosphodiesterase